MIVSVLAVSRNNTQTIVMYQMSRNIVLAPRSVMITIS